MRLPNPVVRLPRWRWLERFDRWRLQRGFFTGYWTQPEIDELRRRARARRIELLKHIDFDK